jgi:hypothetical protein
MNGSVQVIAPVTPTPTPTLSPSVTPTSPPASPSPTFTPFRGAVPMLGGAGRVALALGLIAAAWILLSSLRD